jgi:hypothetical protein
MRWLLLVWIVIFSVHAGECQTFESDTKPLEFYWTQAQKIKTGVTTEDEVRNLLGTPSYSTGGLVAKRGARVFEKANLILSYGFLPTQDSEWRKYAVKVIIDRETGTVKKLVINRPK